MNDFARWLGSSNGKTMIYEVGKDCTLDQFRTVVTTYCILFDVEVDTKAWDDLMRELFNNLNCWVSNYEEFDTEMGKWLV